MSGSGFYFEEESAALSRSIDPQDTVAAPTVLSHRVTELRRAIRTRVRGLRIPGRSYNDDVETRLVADRDLMLGGTLAQLERLRNAGKNHLCVIPHGPLHYYPIHLLGGR